MQLRSFTELTNAVPIQVFDRPVTLVNLDGYAAGAGWLQLFDSTTAPTTEVTVPLKSFNVAAAGPLPSLFSTLGPIEFKNGLYIALSSTEAVYTAVNTNYDVFGEVEEYRAAYPGSSSFDSVTGVLTQQAWADSAGPKRLLTLEVFNLEPGVRYVHIFAKDSVADGDVPLLSLPIAPSATKTWDFGNGYSPIRVSGTTVNDGCTIGFSTTGPTFTGITSSGAIISGTYV